MTTPTPSQPPIAPAPATNARPRHRPVRIALQVVLVIALGLELWQQQWLNALATGGVLTVTLLPVVLGRRFQVHIPPEYEALTLIFAFAALFLGEVQGYYARFWWWDSVLHLASGLLLGVFGFLLAYVLNKHRDIGVFMRPGFVALFAFLFALGLGVLWEIFEFAMDSLFGTTMLESGLDDTMWDLIVDTIGAAVIAIVGYTRLKDEKPDSFLERWIEELTASNPRWFRDS